MLRTGSVLDEVYTSERFENGKVKELIDQVLFGNLRHVIDLAFSLAAAQRKCLRRGSVYLNGMNVIGFFAGAGITEKGIFQIGLIVIRLVAIKPIWTIVWI